MEPFYKNNQFRIAAALITMLLLGVAIGKFLFSGHEIGNPRLAVFNGEAIYMKDVETGMSETERTGNSLEYKKQLAANMIRDRLLAQLASKDSLSVQEFVRKIKSSAETAISNEELEKFLREGGFNRAKMSKAQLDNIKANMQEHKRQLYFNEFIKKEMANNKIIWDNP